MEAHNSLCAVLLQMSQFDAVAAHYRQILAVKPDYVDAYNTLAFALIGAGDAAGALEALLGAFRLADLDDSKALFVLCLKNLSSLPPSAAARGLLLRAMSEPWGRPSGVARHCAALVKANPGIAPCIDEAANAWPAPVSVERSLPAAAGDDVLRCLLENVRVTDIAIERYLTNVRRALLECVAAGASQEPNQEPDAGLLGLLWRARAPVLHQRVCLRIFRGRACGRVGLARDADRRICNRAPAFPRSGSRRSRHIFRCTRSTAMKLLA